MIEREYSGNILDSPMQTLICTVNLQGAMGKGIAKAMADAYPGLLYGYREALRSGNLRMGSLWMFYPSEYPDKQILCMPTKNEWRLPSKIEYIIQGLETLVKEFYALDIKSLAVPPLGCGNGGLNWYRDVRPLVFAYLDGFEVPIEIVG